jgi:FKBP-type peptidyl-prolyl cis-trans isomerase
MNIFARKNKGNFMKNISVALLSIILFFGCSGKADVTTMKSGLKYSEMKVGAGNETKMGDLVSIHFKAWIIKDSSDLYSDWAKDSTKNADLIADSYTMPQAVKFILGSDSFIKGSDEGIVGMKTGGSRIIIIPSNLAYGNVAMGPIPANSNLKVLVELIESKKAVEAKMWDVDPKSMKVTKSGLQYSIITEGDGAKVEKNKQVTVHYSGFLQDSTRFDSSVERDEPFTFVAGVGQVIPGWDEGVQLLKVGSKARFIIPSVLGYGDRDLGKIKPNSTLVFDVEILEVK